MCKICVFSFLPGFIYFLFIQIGWLFLRVLVSVSSFHLLILFSALSFVSFRFENILNFRTGWRAAPLHACLCSDLKQGHKIENLIRKNSEEAHSSRSSNFPKYAKHKILETHGHECSQFCFRNSLSQLVSVNLNMIYPACENKLARNYYFFQIFFF